MRNLQDIARRYVRCPSDIEALAVFIDTLSQEKSVEAIREILSLDHERIAGLALLRLGDLLPLDVDLQLTTAYWYYNYGQDEDARKYLDRAKLIAGDALFVLQTEVYFSYGSPAYHILSLCEAALISYPDDRWLNEIRNSLEAHGRLTSMNGPPLVLNWQNALVTDQRIESQKSGGDPKGTSREM
jgi:hypothetical protein